MIYWVVAALLCQTTLAAHRTKNELKDHETLTAMECDKDTMTCAYEYTTLEWPNANFRFELSYDDILNNVEKGNDVSIDFKIIGFGDILDLGFPNPFTDDLFPPEYSSTYTISIYDPNEDNKKHVLDVSELTETLRSINFKTGDFYLSKNVHGLQEITTCPVFILLDLEEPLSLSRCMKISYSGGSVSISPAEDPSWYV